MSHRFFSTLFILLLTYSNFGVENIYAVPQRRANPNSGNFQCPCMIKPGTTECLQYDARYQAANLDEAVSSFLDLSLSDEPRTFMATATESSIISDGSGDLPPLGSVSMSVDTADMAKQGLNPPIVFNFGDNENSESESKACKDLLENRLQQIGLMARPSKPVNTTRLSTLSCNKYRFARGDQSVYTYGRENAKKYQSSSENDGSSDDDSDDDHDNDKEYYSGSGSGYSVYDPNVEFLSPNKEKLPYEKRALPSLDISVNWENEPKLEKIEPNTQYRHRRQASGLNVIGTRYNLSCTAKGINDGSGYINLCSKCWAWRQLPDHYFPQFINELVCDDMDNDCLSGFATCGPGTRVMEVLRNDSGVLNVVTLSAGSYCECKVLAGSQLQNLVTGQGSTPNTGQETTRLPPTTNTQQFTSTRIQTLPPNQPPTRNLPIIGR